MKYGAHPRTWQAQRGPEQTPQRTGFTHRCVCKPVGACVRANVLHGRGGWKAGQLDGVHLRVRIQGHAIVGRDLWGAHTCINSCIHLCVHWPVGPSCHFAGVCSAHWLHACLLTHLDGCGGVCVCVGGRGGIDVLSWAGRCLRTGGACCAVHLQCWPVCS